MTLEVYAAPLRAMPVDEVDTAAVLAVLQPIWSTKPETASRLRGRIEAVIDAARVSGHIGRNEANPARWKGHLEKLLPRARKLARGHHAAMAYSVTSRPSWHACASALQWRQSAATTMVASMTNLLAFQIALLP